MSLACLMIATPTLAFGDPQQAQTWLSEQLNTHWGASDNPQRPDPRSWAVARVIAGDPLLQTRPIVRDQNNSLETEILRDMTHCTIAAHRYLPQNSGARPIVACRYPQWAGVCIADDMVEQWNQHPEQRQALKSGLPDFLSRELMGKRAEALLFFSALGALFEQGHLAPHRSETSDMLSALAGFDRKLQDICQGSHNLSLWLTDGRVLFVLHHGTPLAMCLGPKPDRSSQHTLRHKATEGAPSVLITTSQDHSSLDPAPIQIEPQVFAVDAQRPTEIIAP